MTFAILAVVCAAELATMQDESHMQDERVCLLQLRGSRATELDQNFLQTAASQLKCPKGNRPCKVCQKKCKKDPVYTQCTASCPEPKAARRKCVGACRKSCRKSCVSKHTKEDTSTTEEAARLKEEAAARLKEEEAARRKEAEEAEARRKEAEEAEARRKEAEEAEARRKEAEEAEARRNTAEEAEFASLRRCDCKTYEVHMGKKASGPRMCQGFSGICRPYFERNGWMFECNPYPSNWKPCYEPSAHGGETDAARREAEAQRKREEEEAARQKTGGEAARLAEEAEARRKAAEEAEARLKEAEGTEARRKAAEEAEARRKEAEEAEARRKEAEEAEARRKEAEEAEARRKEAEEAEARRKAAEEAEARRKAAEEAEARRKAAEEAEARRKREEAAVAPTGQFAVTSRQASVPGSPYVAATQWSRIMFRPGTHWHQYGTVKHFWPVTRDMDGADGVVWQDQLTTAIQVTWFTPEGSTDNMLRPAGHRMEFAVGDGTNIIFFTSEFATTVCYDGGGCQNGVTFAPFGPGPSSKSTLSTLTLTKVDNSGRLVKRVVVPNIRNNRPGPSGGLNVHHTTGSGTSARWNVGGSTIAAVMSHALTIHSDGLNHHVATAFTIDPNSLAMTRIGWTSSHSFGQSLVTSGSGFMGMDLGDNAPRGLHAWRFGNNGGITSKKVVYSFKTKHRNPTSSNDNRMYTELAHPGIEDVPGGVLMFFAGEGPPALDNSKAITPARYPRNIASVKMSSNLQSYVSKGPVETGHFYDYWGNRQAQRNEGVRYYTHYTSVSESVSRIKTARLGPGNTLLIWEVWSTAYVRTEALLVDDDGAPRGRPTVVATDLRLDSSSDPVVKDGRVVIYSSSGRGKLERFEISV